MSDENAFRSIARAALPLYLSTLAASAGALVDTALLGRHATASLAAFAVTTAVFAPATATVAGALRGVMPFVVPCKGEPDALRPIVRNAMWLALTVGVVCAAAVASVPLIGDAVGVPVAVLDQLGVFPLLLAGSVLFIAVGQSATSVLVALGHGTQVMRAGLLSTATSVTLSVLLVGAPGPLPTYGLTGAGVAMLAAAVAGAWANQTTLRRRTVLAGHPLRPGRPDPRRMLRLAAVGIPLAGTVLIKFAVLGVLTFAAARVGTDSAAVHSVSESLVNVMFTVAVAVGQAMVPLTAGLAGEGDVAGVRRSLRAGVGVTLSAVAVLGAVLLLFRHSVVPLFTSDDALRPQVVSLLPLVLLVVVTDALQAVAGFALIGLKRTMPSLVSTAVWFGALAMVAVPVAEAGGLTALWAALACANLLQAVTKSVSFRVHSARGGATAPPSRPAGSPSAAGAAPGQEARVAGLADQPE
ncbi:MATE family efflux transporter [Streptomyces sp. NPDC093591]|uniref:MATE family efflux transporter n=1 Tax=Streptomyces sp. NPDC093591 TaxID=3366044 RepID=UPI00381EF6F3